MAIGSKKKIILVGDRVLIEPEKDQERSPHGLYLPPGVKEREKVNGGWVVQVGPGYPVINPNYIDQEPWSTTPKEPVKYIPLQAEVGDYALFLRDQAIEIEFETKTYLIVPQSALLMLVRHSPLDDIRESLTDSPDV
jgi:chaperonin GroES